jgi:hypothetical protein
MLSIAKDDGSGTGVKTKLSATPAAAEAFTTEISRVSMILGCPVVRVTKVEVVVSRKANS